MSLGINEWFAHAGDATLRLNYNLNSESIVFDLGGYHGEWSEKIYNLYNCNIYIFEPITELANNIQEKFKNNNKIKVFNYGLSDENNELFINVNNDGSSFNTTCTNPLKCEVKSIIDFLDEYNINKVDLIKINIEGDEYKLLDSLIENNKIILFDNIQVQFHRFIENSPFRREKIQNELSKTHKQTYNYDFVWENWEVL